MQNTEPKYCKVCKEIILGYGKKYCSKKCQGKDPEWREIKRQNAIKQFSDLEQRKKSSLITKKRWQNPQYREKLKKANVGKRKRALLKYPEILKNHGESMKKKWRSDGYREALSKACREGAKKRWEKPGAHEKAKQSRLKVIIPFSDTKIEKNIQEYLKKDNIVMKGFTAQEIWDKDSCVAQKLESQGYKVLRFWENDINNNFDLVKNRIDEIVKGVKK